MTGASSSLASRRTGRSPAAGRVDRHSPRSARTDEFADPNYLRRTVLTAAISARASCIDKIEPLARRLGLAVIVNGANVDDMGDYRPGMTAAAEHAVRQPAHRMRLREEARFGRWPPNGNLPIWDKPAMPCLSSRIAYGEEVTPERLAMIDGAERFLRAAGLRELRVRYHKGDLARIEVPADALPHSASEPFRSAACRGTQAPRLQVSHARSRRISLGEPESGADSGGYTRCPLTDSC